MSQNNTLKPCCQVLFELSVILNMEDAIQRRGASRGTYLVLRISAVPIRGRRRKNLLRKRGNLRGLSTIQTRSTSTRKIPARLSISRLRSPYAYEFGQKSIFFLTTSRSFRILVHYVQKTSHAIPSENKGEGPW